MFGITRHAYYKHEKRFKLKSYQSQVVLNIVKGIRQEQPRIGTRKLYHLLLPKLKEHQIKLGRDALFDLLAEFNMLVRRRKRRVFTTNSVHSLKVYPNLIKDLIIDAPNMVWVSDITYLKIESGFIYLFLITDAYSKKVVGYCLSDNLQAINAKKALEKALEKVQISNELIHHSDRGIQYCSKEYVNLLQKNGIGISMTKRGSPHENAIAERINGILKHELLNTVELKGITNAKKAINKAITIYNGKRPHLSCNMLTPNQAHDYTTNALKPLWKNYKKRKIKHILVDHY